MLERTHLKIIDALRRHSSLTKAAEELHVTQSALTHSIRKLEELLGVRLWQKAGRGLRLTPAGEYLSAAARRLEPQLRETEEQLKAYAGGKRGIMRIGVECHPCYEFLLAVIDSFLKRWPDVDVDVTRDFRFNGYQALKEYHIDALISPDRIEYPGLIYHAVLDFELLLAVAPGHPLATAKHIEPKDLRDQTLLTYPIEKERLDVYTSFLNPAGIRPAQHKSVESTEIMLQMVNAGRGVSTFPDWVIQKHRATTPVSGLKLGPQGLYKQLFVVQRESQEPSAFGLDFITLALEAAQVIKKS